MVNNEKAKFETLEFERVSNRNQVEKIIQLKEEKNLVSRFLITAWKRPELELERCSGDYEFSIVPKSLFTEDAVPSACKDKFTVINILENLENS